MSPTHPYIAASVAPVIRSTRTNPLSNYVSTADTIAKMIDIAKTYALSPVIAHATQSCLASLHNSTHSPTSQDLCRRVFWFAKTHVTFQEDDKSMWDIGIDPYANGGRDYLITPDLLLSMPRPMGDCDDFSDLVVAMLICGGFVRSFGRGWFVTIATDDRDKEAFTHVYTKWFCPDTQDRPYIYIDASHGKYPGWESPKCFRKKEWEIR